MAIAPLAKLPELLDFGVTVVDVVLNGQTLRVIHPNIATKPEEDAGCLKCDEAGVGSSLAVSNNPTNSKRYQRRL